MSGSSTAVKTRSMRSLFLDTAYVVALAIPADQYHGQALALADSFEQEHLRVVTTRAVLVEIGNALARPSYRAASIAYLQSLEQDPAAEIVPLTEELYSRAFDLYQSREDKEWGLVDCISFVVMEEQGITDALTADKHFEQAGFNVLLRR